MKDGSYPPANDKRTVADAFDQTRAALSLDTFDPMRGCA
jgi:hypothetical protein